MLWLKAFHVISIVCWFAGLFYLPRLFVYHALATDQATRDHLKIMERKLYRFTSPFALFALVLGVAMALQNPDYYLHARWLQIKLLLVFFLYGYHGHCGKLLKQFAHDDIRHSHVYYRWFNEVPALLLFAIVILAVVKPW